MTEIPKAAIEAALDVLGELNVDRNEVIEALQAAAPFMQQQWHELAREGAVAERELGYAAGIEAAAKFVETPQPDIPNLAAAIRALTPQAKP